MPYPLGHRACDPGPGLKLNHLGLRCGLPGLARLATPGMAVDNFETQADPTIGIAGFLLQPLA